LYLALEEARNASLHELSLLSDDDASFGVSYGPPMASDDTW